jgi:peptidoglycan-associated lipoprotein
MSTDKGGTWSAGKELNGINIEGTLSKSPTMGELFGKKVLFFASNRDGGEGGWDLYYATEKGDGVYGDPVNLGPRLNTIGDEIDGFYRDGMLYFSSTGHAGIGGYDLFQSEWNGVRWGDPKNMGLGYNSTADDLGFMLDQEGFRGFLTSNRIAEGSRSVKSKTCCDDIYNINLRKIEVDLIAVAMDSLEKDALIGVTMELFEMSNGKQSKVDRKTNTAGNDFPFEIELDKAYKIVASAENYESKTVEFNTIGVLDNKTFNEMLTLRPLPTMVTITSETPFVLDNILYDFNKSNIRPDAEPSLEFIYEIMIENPAMKIELSSHTDARGGDAANQKLAQNRAEAARRWLLARNEGAIKRFRIVAKGYGESVPQMVTEKVAGRYGFLNTGDVLTEEFIGKIEGEENQEVVHQLNRRTEFKITDGPESIIIEETRIIQLGNKKIDEKVKEMPDKQSMPKTKVQDAPKQKKN